MRTELFINGKKLGETEQNEILSALPSRPTLTSQATVHMVGDGCCNSCKHLNYEYAGNRKGMFFQFYCGVRVYRPCKGRVMKFYLKRPLKSCVRYERADV